MQTEHVSKDVAISSHLLSSFFAAHIILVMMIPILHYNECFKTMPTRFSCQMSMEPEPNIKYCDDKRIKNFLATILLQFIHILFFKENQNYQVIKYSPS